MPAPSVPDIAVVVPTFGRPKLLTRLVAALEAQTLDRARFEVVIVDDCSPHPETAEVLAEIAATTPLDLRVMRSPENRGPAAARNLGWRSTTSPLVAFTDDDCVPHPDWLRQALASAQATPDLAILQGATLRPPGPYPYGPHTVYRETVAPSPYFEGSNLVFPRAVLERTGGFDEVMGWYGEDTAAGWAALEGGGAWVFDETCVVTHDIEERPWRWLLMMAWREGRLVDVAARHPRFRAEALWRPWAHRPWNAAVALGVLGTVAALRWRVGLLAWVPWLVLRRPPVRSLPRGFLAMGHWWCNDIVVLAAMLRASIRNRTLVL